LVQPALQIEILRGFGIDFDRSSSENYGFTQQFSAWRPQSPCQRLPRCPVWECKPGAFSPGVFRLISGAHTGPEESQELQRAKNGNWDLPVKHLEFGPRAYPGKCFKAWPIHFRTAGGRHKRRLPSPNRVFQLSFPTQALPRRALTPFVRGRTKEPSPGPGRAVTSGVFSPLEAGTGRALPREAKT